MSSPFRRSLPLRGQAESARPAGPKPFSREWHSLPPEQRVVAAKRRRGIPPWMPSERTLTSVLVALLVLTSTVIQTGLAPSVAGSGSGSRRGNPQVAGAGHVIDPTATATLLVPAVATETSAPVDGPTATATGEVVDPTETPVGEISLDGAGGETDPDAEATEADREPTRKADSAKADAATADTAAMAGAILPKYRILAYYGHPADERMGILGAYNMDELLAQLRDEAATYEAADPDRPVMPAFEVIASVAQGVPGADGSYLLHTDHDTIMEYVDFTAKHDIMLILDIQIGYTSVEEDMATVEEYLRYPNVHLAIDPEFSLSAPDVPSQVIGGVDGEEVTSAQERLVAICAEEGIPPKVLIVHRFRHEMIRDDERVKPVVGVQLVVDMDGFGHPGLKMDSYKIFVTDKDPEYAGIKIFYDQDQPVMSADEVLDLDPSPDYVMYQ